MSKTIKIHLILPDNVVTSYEFTDNESLETLQKLCQGYIEELTVLYLGKKRVAFVNEEGRALDMSFNVGATKAFNAAHEGFIMPPLFGPMAVIVS